MTSVLVFSGVNVRHVRSSRSLNTHTDEESGPFVFLINKFAPGREHYLWIVLIVDFDICINDLVSIANMLNK